MLHKTCQVSGEGIRTISAKNKATTHTTSFNNNKINYFNSNRNTLKGKCTCTRVYRLDTSILGTDLMLWLHWLLNIRSPAQEGLFFVKSCYSVILIFYFECGSRKVFLLRAVHYNYNSHNKSLPIQSKCFNIICQYTCIKNGFLSSQICTIHVVSTCFIWEC